jgi:hypothetical protein
MLYWICPECGRECSPAIRECPACTAPPVALKEAEGAAPAQTAANHELLSLAQNFQPTPATALLAAEPQRQHLSANGNETSITTTALAVADEPVEEVEPVEEAEPVEKIAPEPQLSKTLVPLGELALRPARPVRPNVIKPSLTPVPARVSSPVVAQPAAQARPNLSLKPAWLLPAGDIDLEAASSRLPGTVAQPSEPVPSRRQSVAFVRAESPGPDHGRMAMAGLTSPNPAQPHRNGQPKPAAPTQLVSKPSGPSFVPSGLAHTGESLAELQRALTNSAEENERTGIQAIQNSLVEPPAMSLLTAPTEIVTPPAPIAEQWMSSGKPKFSAVAPEITGRVALIAGPRTPTLAGPSLPPQLLNFNRQNSSLRPRKRWAIWPISLLVATTLILGAVSLLQYSAQDRDTKAAAPVVAPVQAARASHAPRLPVLEEHPAARSVEVAGVRILTAPNKKPQLQFIVINHSASELTGLNIRISVRSVEALEDAPLFTVSSIVGSLGPNQSKEIRAEVTSPIQPSDIPDWQSLRPEILIGRQ